MKINIVFLTLALTIFSIQSMSAITPAPARPATTQMMTLKKKIKAHAPTALKGIAYTSFGFYLADFAIPYLKALTKGASTFKSKDTNTYIENLFTKGLYPMVGIWGLYAVMRLTGNVSEFDQEDIDAGFMGGAGRESTSPSK